VFLLIDIRLADRGVIHGHVSSWPRFSRAGGVTARLFPGVLLPGLPLVGEAEDDPSRSLGSKFCCGAQMRAR
jgi:hypothetical protein